MASASLASLCNLAGFARLLNRIAAWREVPHLSSALMGLAYLLGSASLRMLHSDSYLRVKENISLPNEVCCLRSSSICCMGDAAAKTPLSQCSCSAASDLNASCSTCLLNLGVRILEACTCLIRHHSNYLPPFAYPNLLLSSSPAA